MTDLAPEDLRQVHEDRKKTQRETYRKIYLQCCDKIKKMNKGFYAKQTTYHVPVMLWGHPLYNMEECLIYMRWRLKKKGIHTQFKYPNVLRISWQNLVDSKLPIEELAERDEHRSKKNDYIEGDSGIPRWDKQIISEKNEKEIEEQRYREDVRRKRHKEKKLQQEEEEEDRHQRHKQEEIEDIIHRKNKQALLAIEYGLDYEKPKKKILQINTE